MAAGLVDKQARQGETLWSVKEALRRDMSSSSSCERSGHRWTKVLKRRRSPVTLEGEVMTRKRRGGAPLGFRSAASSDPMGRRIHLPRMLSGAGRRHGGCRSSVIVIHATALLVLRSFEATHSFPLAASTVTRHTGAVIFGAGASERRRQATSSATTDEFVTDDAAMRATTETFVMPVFPLRKSVRVPTQSLTLNLYEPRYVALAERVLYGGGDCVNDDDAQRCGGGAGGGRRGRSDRPRLPHRRIFGALYCSSKTQIVRDGGQGPITPLVDVGDVGAVCNVLDHSDTVRGDGTRKISIRALAVGRFRVERILSDGYTLSVRTSRDGGEDPVEGGALPYILVEASRVDDVIPPAGSDEEADVIEAEDLLFRSMLDVEGEGGAGTFAGGGSDVEEDEVFLAANRLAPWVEDERGDGDGDGEGAAIDAMTATSREERLLRAWSACVERVDANGAVPWPPLDEHRRRELYSFAMLAALLSNKPRPAVEVETLLHITSTKKRLDFVLRFMDEDRWWRRLFGWL